MPAIASTSGRLHVEFIRILFLQAHRETDRFFASSGVTSSQSDRGLYHYRRAAVSSILKSRVGNILAKSSTLRINLNIDGSAIPSKSQTHPSHSRVGSRPCRTEILATSFQFRVLYTYARMYLYILGA